MDPSTAARVDVLTQGVVPKDKHHHSESPVGGELELSEIDWNDINDEVDAAMNESDDDDEEDEHKVLTYWADEDDERCVQFHKLVQILTTRQRTKHAQKEIKKLHAKKW